MQRLLEYVGWEPREMPSGQFERMEGELGTQLPGDYKELGEAFGAGTFCDVIYFCVRDEGKVFDLLSEWHSSLSVEGDSPAGGEGGGASLYAPYGIYRPGRGGLIPWGSTEWADEYYWLAEGPDPASWPILARTHSSREWHRFEMSTSEFLYKALTDPEFSPFGVARYSLDPSFEPVPGSN
ncbi:SMI1/KNR4 family protein [Streptomyces sp. NPDC048425]|uniref:SMI1/KNR4 family protein n=1 Tax=Streptomyces sp. NPDC048425 TaxID=3365548 RepID=UPI003710E8AA